MRSLFKLRHFVAAGFIALLPAGAWGQSAARYQVRPWPESAVFGLSLAGTLAPQALADRLGPSPCRPCDPAGLAGFDRIAVGPVRRAPARVSDLLMLGTFGASVLLATDAAPPGGSYEDVFVVAQSVLVTSAVTNWTKLLVHRTRPHLYDPSATEAEPGVEDRLSFPSGHTSATFAAAAAYMAVQDRRGQLGARGTEAAVLLGMAGITATLRVAAHRHFPSDVLAGTALGLALGWLVPQAAAVR